MMSDEPIDLPESGANVVVGDEPETMAAMPDPQTPDPNSTAQKEAGFEEARTLAETDIEINTAFHAMVTSRYVHQIAKEKLLTLVKKKAKEPLTEAMIVSAAIFESEHNQLSPQQVRERYVNILTPFVIATVGVYEVEERQQRHTDIALAEAERRKRPLVIGDLTLDRSRPIVIPVFWAPFINLVIEQFLLSLPDDHGMRIVRLTNAKSHPDAVRKCIEVPARMFDNMGQSAERFQHAITELIHGKLRQSSIDLLIIDDLLKLAQPSIVGMDAARHAAVVQKNIRKGVKEVGAALMCGFQTNHSACTDPKDSMWGPLATYTRILEPVASEPIDGIRTLELGPLTFRVEEEAWDKSRGLGIIIPN